MEFNFSPTRVLLFILFLVFFYWIDGFTPIRLEESAMLDSQRVGKAWFYTVLMFLTGAVSASVVDHYVGFLDRSNIRLIYILLGAVLMSGSYLWISSLKEAVRHL